MESIAWAVLSGLYLETGEKKEGHMDPKANLREQRVLSAGLSDIDPDNMSEEQMRRALHDAARLAELVQALDAWITGGGFSPWNGGAR